MTEDQRKLEQMKLYRLWKRGHIDAKTYGDETLKLLERWAAANYGKLRERETAVS